MVRGALGRALRSARCPMQMRCDQSCVWLLTPPAAPWCGDCKRTDAGVDRAAAKLQASVLRVDVGDRDSWRAPNHPLRLDPRVQLRCIPTLVQWFDDKAIARVGQPSFFFVGGEGGLVGVWGRGGFEGHLPSWVPSTLHGGRHSGTVRHPYAWTTIHKLSMRFSSLPFPQNRRWKMPPAPALRRTWPSLSCARPRRRDCMVGSTQRHLVDTDPSSPPA